MPLGLGLIMGLGHNVAASGGGGGGSGATWNPSDKNADFSLSAGNLTASRPSGTGDALLRATVGKATAGSFTVTVDAIGSNLVEIGVANISASTSTYLGDPNGAAYISDGRILVNNSVVTTVASYTTGDVIAVTWDGTNVSWKKNGGSTLATVDIHVAIPTAYPAASTNGTGGVMTINTSGW
jgi:hypothetical protein